MSLILIGAALTLARWWTRLYTVGAPSHVARARRAEIETDLWEFERDLPQTPTVSPRHGHVCCSACRTICPGDSTIG